MPPGMRSAKGGLGLDQTADSTVEPGLVIELKEGGAKERTGKRILAKREARERGDWYIFRSGEITRRYSVLMIVQGWN